MDACVSLLIIEELLADGRAWEQASDSLRQEAVAMVTAVTTDAVRLADLKVTLLLSEDAAELLTQRNCLPAELQIMKLRCPLDTWLRSQNRQDPDRPQTVLLIAPESDGVLVQRLKVLQSEVWNGTESLNLSRSLAATFSDKFRTFQWLKARGISTPETWLLSTEQADRLRHTATQSVSAETIDNELSGEAWTAVLKPRNGVGCDQVDLLQLTVDELAAVASSSVRIAESEAAWIVQPWVPGAACSIGLIGGGVRRGTVILPAGRQTLRRHGARVSYRGGEIPCDADWSVAIAPVADALAAAMGPFHGWLGADIVVGQHGQQTDSATVIEINPRLCTSYVGYRQLACGNLAEWLLQRATSEHVNWRSGVVRFGADGRTQVDVGD